MKNPAASHAREYLKSRGFGQEMAVRWALGSMPGNPRIFIDCARAQKFTGRQLVDSGIEKQKEENDPKAGLFVRFQDRFPPIDGVSDGVNLSPFFGVFYEAFQYVF